MEAAAFFATEGSLFTRIAHAVPRQTVRKERLKETHRHTIDTHIMLHDNEQSLVCACLARNAVRMFQVRVSHVSDRNGGIALNKVRFLKYLPVYGSKSA